MIGETTTLSIINAADARHISAEALRPVFIKIMDAIKERASKGYSSVVISASYGDEAYGHSETISNALEIWGFTVDYRTETLKQIYTISW